MNVLLQRYCEGCVHAVGAAAVGAWQQCLPLTFNFSRFLLSPLLANAYV